MSSEFAIQAENLSKIYHLYRRPSDRFRQFLFGHRRTYYQAFAALSNVSFSLAKGEVLGLIGRNGAGKSTLLQLICGTLQPSSGKLRVNGRVAALLELGAGFNPEFSGRENVYLNASILGLSKAEIDDRYEEIVAFADIGEFIHQPVKTYSSGMYVRLAFSVATSVDPDILVIDEALSVGDGAFARKSFDRIMQLRAKGATILFCSHSMYHIQAICNQAIWLEKGIIKESGNPPHIIANFQSELSSQIKNHTVETTEALKQKTTRENQILAYFKSVEATTTGVKEGNKLYLKSKQHHLIIKMIYFSENTIEVPQVAISIDTIDGQTLSTTASIYDQTEHKRDENGNTIITITYPNLALLQGRYIINLFLTCGQLLHVYDKALQIAEIIVTQETNQLGLVDLPHHWNSQIN